MTAPSFVDPTPPGEAVPPLDPIGLVLADALRELIYTGATTSERSLQQAVGVSEIGAECKRQLAYKVAGTPPVHIDENPMPAIIGTGFHLHVQRIIEGLDRRRYLVETPVTYKGVPGTVDLYDRRRRTLIDWKSTSKGKLRKLRQDGPPQRARVQIQIYGAALRALGEDPVRLALAYVPRDGSLEDLWVWSTTPDQKLVDEWMARFELITDDIARGLPPGQMSALPGPLCSYCPFFQPTSTDPARGCPGPNM